MYDDQAWQKLSVSLNMITRNYWCGILGAAAPLLVTCLEDVNEVVAGVPSKYIFSSLDKRISQWDSYVVMSQSTCPGGSRLC